MVSFDEEEQDGPASGDDSSHNDVDETMDDVDADADVDADQEGDGEVEGDGEGDEDENEDDEDDDDQDNTQDSRRPSQNGAYSSSNVQNGQIASDTAMRRSTSNTQAKLIDRPSPRPEALTASMYDIVPTIAAPQATSINALAATADMRWVFSAGSDGYVRRFNWPDTVNSKSMLTVAQRHPYVDSVVKHGVLQSYWAPAESELQNGVRQGSPTDMNISPIQSIAVHHQGLWILAGQETGAISLHTVRHSESTRIATLSSHTSAVSVLTLANDERSVLSGSWDKSVLDWDLNTGQVRRRFGDGGGQISSIELRPESTLPVPAYSWPPPHVSDTFSSNNTSRPTHSNNALANGETEHRNSDAMLNGFTDTGNSPANSLFGGNSDNNSLFGDGGDGGPVNAPGDEYDTDLSRMFSNGGPTQPDGDISMTDAAPPSSHDDSTLPNGVSTSQPDPPLQNGVLDSQTPTQSISWPPPSSDDSAPPNASGGPVQDSAPPTSTSTTTTAAPPPPVSYPISTSTSSTTFFDTAMDGVLRVWDRRQHSPIATVSPRWAPPWCMSACWSPDGNSIYVGRRNNTVDEFSLGKGFAEPTRIFKFPAGSGSVSAIRGMPNGRHLLCASHDILRLYDLRAEEQSKRSTVPFTIVPGHRTGVISTLHIDPTCRFILSAGGTRGWEGGSTDVLLGYELNISS
ncbi:MAG: Transcription factor spt8 [Bogoriella megaspora]|nr:MAG: Transcription factor spt8 [Bogoriella megaspora]